MYTHGQIYPWCKVLGHMSCCLKAKTQTDLKFKTQAVSNCYEFGESSATWILLPIWISWELTPSLHVC